MMGNIFAMKDMRYKINLDIDTIANAICEIMVSYLVDSSDVVAKEMCRQKLLPIIKDSLHAIINEDFSIDNITSQKQLEEILKPMIYDMLGNYIKSEDIEIPDEIQRILTDIYGLVICSLYNDGDLNTMLRELALEVTRQQAERLAKIALEQIVDKMPESDTKQILLQEFEQLSEIGLNNFGDTEAMTAEVKNHIINNTIDYAEKRAGEILNKTIENMPDFAEKDRVSDLLNDTMHNTFAQIKNGGSVEDIYQSAIQISKVAAGKYASDKSKVIIDQAVNKAFAVALDKRRGQGNSKHNKNVKDYRQATAEALSDNVATNINALFNGEKDFQTALSDTAVDSSMEIGKKYVKEKSAALVGKQIKKIADKQKRTGKGSREHNKKINNDAERFADNIANNTADNMEALLRGEKNIVDAGKDILVDSTTSIVQDRAKEKGTEVVGKQINKAAAHLMKKGPGSKAHNKLVKSGADIATNQVIENVFYNAKEVLNGQKDVGQAIKDTAKDTGKGIAVEYAKKHGTEIVKKAIVSLEKEALKRIGNEAVKNTVVSGLKSVGKSNVIVATAGAVVDIGQSVKKYLDGKITSDELVREIGEKGTGAVVSMAFAAAGTAVAGPLGAAVGSFVGYIATEMLYNTVLKAFSDADKAKQNYEIVHQMCEESINAMNSQRIAFEQETQKLFKRREVNFSDALTVIDQSFETNDFDSLTTGLNKIAGEFDKELQFKNFDEFDDFMMNEESVFEL